MAERLFNVLFLCTHNSARSVMAEALLNTIGRGRFHAFSAGSMPSGRVNPFAVEMARTIGYLTDNIRSKSWDEFARPGAEKMDIIITVCDDAAGEVCPVWPGHPATAHWGFPDPSNTPGSDGVVLVAGNVPARALLIAGRPLNEPIAQYGPFVMNTRAELVQAVEDYQAGRLA